MSPDKFKSQNPAEFFEAVIENIGNGIVVFGADGRISNVNRAFEAQSGVARGEAEGRFLWEVFPSWDGEDIREVARRILENGQTYENERVYLAAEGDKPLVANVIICPFGNPDGRTRSAVALIDYISDKVQLEEHLIRVNEELYRANRAKMDFLSMVSHELRTPLTLIKMYTALLSEGKLGPLTPKQVKALEVMERRCNSLNKLIGDLLDLSRIEAGGAGMELTRVSLHRAIMTAVANFEHSILEKKIDLIVRVAPELPDVTGDHDKLQRLISNLVENAVKFTEPGGRIVVEAKAAEDSGEGGEGERALVSVSDTGIGIPESEFTRIFERFYQVDGSDTRKHMGSGLGLTIAKQIVELHNGQMWLESKEGQGTAFYFTLPVNRRDAAPEAPVEKAAARRAPAEAAAPGAAGARVLLIDDDQDFLEVVEDLLRSGGFQIETATDGVRGLDRALSLPPPEVILLDVTMPRLSGYDLCRFLKSMESTRGIPVMMLTAAGQEEQVTLGYEAGASGYLVKPFEIPEFEAELKRILGR